MAKNPYLVIAEKSCQRCYGLAEKYGKSTDGLELLENNHLWNAMNTALEALPHLKEGYLVVVEPATDACRQCDFSSPGIAEVIKAREFPGGRSSVLKEADEIGKRVAEA